MIDGKISILMGIYNCENTLVEAVESIQNQTYTNWELVMCDDGSNDNSFAVAKKIAEKEKRIKLISNERNLGLNKTLNKCFKISTGEFIARMDGDDISEPTRFERQLEILYNKNEYDIVSTRMYMFDENGIWGHTHQKEFPTKEDVVMGSPICHAPVMMRRKCLEDVGGYTEGKNVLRVEDVDLWIKLYSKGYKCYNIQENLYGMRNDKNALARRKYKYRINSTRVRLRGCKVMNLGFKCYIMSFVPMVNGLVPARIRNYIRHLQGRNV